MKLRRIDSELVRRGIAPSRSSAARMIEEGRVQLDGQVVLKAARQMDPAQAIVVAESDEADYVSRGAHKLAGVLDALGDRAPRIRGRRALDAGASTGGFTDVLLRRGAASVVAVDVGYGQLAWKLRNDPRVVCMEKTNIRYVTPEDINDKIELVSIDVSFISLTKVLVPVKKLMAEDGQIVCLIKPQFEAGREKVGKKGVVREKSTHLEVINMVIDFAVEAGFEVLNLEFSPIKGPEGNIEYLLHLQNHRDGEHYDNVTVDPAQVVEAAHSELDK